MCLATRVCLGYVVLLLYFIPIYCYIDFRVLGWDLSFYICLWFRLMKNLQFVQILPYCLETLLLTLMMGSVLNSPCWLSFCIPLRGYTSLCDHYAGTYILWYHWWLKICCKADKEKSFDKCFHSSSIAWYILACPRSR